MVYEEYGQALYSLATSSENEDSMFDTLTAIASLLKANPDYVKLLDSPAIPIGEKLSLLDEAFGQVEPYALNFTKILCERHMLHALGGCVDAYKKRYYADKGIEEATAITSRPMTDAQCTAMREKLSRLTGKEIRLENRVDPHLIGGVVLRMEGRQLDASVRTRLEDLRRRLAESVL